MTDEKIYFYNGRITLQLDHIKNTNMKIFENGYEAVFNSNPFDEYKDCVKDCANMLGDIIHQIYENSGEKYVLVWESNPKIALTESKTTDLKPWDAYEILRFFAINQGEMNLLGTSVTTPMISSIYGTDKRQFAMLPSSKVTH